MSRRTLIGNPTENRVVTRTEKVVVVPTVLPMVGRRDPRPIPTGKRPPRPTGMRPPSSVRLPYQNAFQSVTISTRVSVREPINTLFSPFPYQHACPDVVPLLLLSKTEPALKAFSCPYVLDFCSKCVLWRVGNDKDNSEGHLSK